jgi:hypothetical protein
LRCRRRGGSDRGNLKERRETGRVKTWAIAASVIHNLLVGLDCDECRQLSAEDIKMQFPRIVDDAMRKAAENPHKPSKEHLH